MAIILKKRDNRHQDLINSYYDRVNEAEKFKDRENAAALII